MTSQAAPDVVIAHWSTLIENFQASPLAFYRAVEEALVRRQVPETRNTRVDYKQAGLLSAKREYLQVTREQLLFDICAAPFGTGFFVSWWLAEAKSLNPMARLGIVLGLLALFGLIVNVVGIFLGLILCLGLVVVGLMIISAMANEGEFDDRFVDAIPFIGWLYGRLFKPTTYYRLDTMLMFQKAVHNAVLEVIDTMTAEKGIRALSELERKPIMREFYARQAV